MTFEAATAGERSFSVLLYVLSGVGIVAGALVVIGLVGAVVRRNQLRDLRMKRTVEEADQAAEWVRRLRQRPSAIREPSDLAAKGTLARPRATATSLTVGQLLAVPQALITVRNAFTRGR